MTSESSNTAALVAEQVEREAERIAESVVRRAPVFLEKVTGDLYETLLSEVQSYLRDNAAFNIKSELSMLRATIAAKDDALSALAKELEEAKTRCQMWFDTHNAHRVACDALGKANGELMKRAMGAERRAEASEHQRDEALAALKASEAREAKMRAALDYLAENESRSLAFDGKTYCEDDNSDLWIVTEVHGGINDREWVLLGSGATPAEALLEALPSSARAVLSTKERGS